MENAMNSNTSFAGSFLSRFLLALLCVMPMTVNAGPADLANKPLASSASSTTVAVKPNIAFLVDDSISMAFESMPDADFPPEYGNSAQYPNKRGAGRCYGWRGFNTIFYNPSVTYKPPFKLDGVVYSDGVKRYPDADFSSALKDGFFGEAEATYLGSGYPGGYGDKANGRVNLETLSNLPMKAVSCSTTDGDPGFGATTQLTVGSEGSATSITNIRVGSVDILTANTSSNNTKNNSTLVAQRITENINARTGTTGYTATYSGTTVTITAPVSAGNLTSTPVVSKSGGKTITTGAFSGYVAPGRPECSSGSSKFYYATHKTNPASSTCEANSNYSIMTYADSIEAPGVPNSNRTAADIAKAKTNYANWYSYYRTRANVMKSAAGEAFKDLDESKYRIGLFYINSYRSGATNAGHDLLIKDFTGSADGTHRETWYEKLYGARMDNDSGPNTPLLGSLSRAGRMFAGKVPGFDPVQYSCQQNFAVLATDGFWTPTSNSVNYGPYGLDGTTQDAHKVGDQDGATGVANATIVFEPLNGTKYYASSLKVSGVELLNGTEIPENGTSETDDLAGEIVASVNARTSATGYSASYDGTTHTLTLTAPASAGDLTVTPSLTRVKVDVGTDRTVTVSAFSRGAKPPYKDGLNRSNTLADIAYYYYQNDLRDQAKWDNCTNTIDGVEYTGLCENNVMGSGRDVNSKQHMTTFTLGMGISGHVKYEQNYESAPDSTGLTYYKIKNGTANWPNPYDSNATYAELAKIDDLWHAAVNGRGTYYSASTAETLQQGLLSALNGVQSRTGSSSAAATSNLEPVAGDNFVYVALYRTLKWDGDLKAFEIDPATGELSGSELWSSQEELDEQVRNAEAATTATDGRTIKYFNDSATTSNKLKDFTEDNLATDGLISHFQNVCARTTTIEQCTSTNLTNAQKDVANDAENMINYLRGRTTYEDDVNNSVAANRIYRGRDHVLGDIVNAVPVYMKKPPFDYGKFDPTYTTFVTDNDTERAATVFIAANDGMLHAINAENSNESRGEERWAYVPRFVMSNMWKLSDRNYGANHQYFVDGSPTIADICTSLKSSDPQLCAAADKWKTILVGGLNKGGCGYYALDVTDPTNPKGLWEFTHPDLGYTYGNPVIAKNKSGKWVVIFASGYNNYPGGCGSTGDGNGHVFVVDANTGVLIDKISTFSSASTPAGTTATPSGLAKLNAWIENASLPVVDRLYGGDLLGNVWRIDFDGNYPAGDSGKEATLLARLSDGGSPAKPQPITTKPEVAEVTCGTAKCAAVMVGTGKYLGDSDLGDESKQSIYAIKDSLGTSGIGDARGTSMIERTMTQTTGSASGTLAGRVIRTISGETVDWSEHNGWYLDLDPNDTSPGERVNVDMSLQFNMLTVAANVPQETACNVGGYAFLYFLDINTGKNLTTSVENMAGVRLSGNALVAGIKTVKLMSGKTVTIVTDTAGNVTSENNPTPTSGGAGAIRRTTWREIPD
jgi:type IV pilus assembly protein PilY1